MNKTIAKIHKFKEILNRKIKMKKIFSISLLFLGLTYFISQAAYATNANSQGDPCKLISSSNLGSKFESSNKNLDAYLFYKNCGGHEHGVSGGFGAIVNGVHFSAPLFASWCNSGIIMLNWIKGNEFYGSVMGVIDYNNRKITNIHGLINGQEVTGELLLQS